MKKTITAIALLTTIASAELTNECRQINRDALKISTNIEMAFRSKDTSKDNMIRIIRLNESMQTLLKFALNNCDLENRAKTMYKNIVVQSEDTIVKTSMYLQKGLK